jgi:hypothetical protein
MTDDTFWRAWQDDLAEPGGLMRLCASTVMLRKAISQGLEEEVNRHHYLLRGW